MTVDLRSRRTTRLGVSQDAWNEIQGIVILFLALATVLSIVSINRRPNLIGPVGQYLAHFLVLALGELVAYVVPGILLIWGVTRFRGIAWSHVVFKVFGLLLLATAGCGLLAQASYDVSRLSTNVAERDYLSFAWGGAVGGFLVSPSGLNLPRYLDRTGTYLALSTALAVGILLATNFLFYRFLAGLWGRVRYGHEAVSRRLERLTERLKQQAAARPSRFRQGRFGRILADDDEPESAEAALCRAEPPRHEPPALIAESPVVATVEEDEEGEDGEEDTESSAAVAVVSEQLDFFAGYQVPAIDLLSPPPPSQSSLTEEDIVALSRTVEDKLATFGIGVEVTRVTEGPVVTLFELQPAPGVKINRIVTLENDLAMALRASRLRIIAPIPGRGTVGIEIPNPKPNMVCLREIVEAREFQNQTAPLTFGLGKTIDGRPYVCNLAKMPHLLIAGTTGSGKSVCLNSIICSFLFRNSPDRVRFIMIDPKRVDLAVFQGIPHLLAPVVSEPRKCAAALAWVVGQMEERYRQLSQIGVRGIDAYNRFASDPERALAKFGRELPYMPHIVIIVDELADLMLVARNEVEENVIRLAQMSRAVGIHLIIATQRPSVNVITGIIKANFPCRIAFQVSQKVDSRTILDMNGAEALLGQGDMLFSPGGSMRPIRIQGAYVSDGDVERLVIFITAQGKAMTEEQLEAERAISSVQERVAREATAEWQEPESAVQKDQGGADLDTDAEGPAGIDDAERLLGQERDRQPVRMQYEVKDFTASDGDGDQLNDELYEKALKLLLESRKASVSLIQRRMKIGYARAGRLMDLMEDRGIVGPYQGSKPRSLLVDPVAYLRKLDARKQD